MSHQLAVVRERGVGVRRTLSEHQVVGAHKVVEGVLSELLDIRGGGERGGSDKAEDGVPEVLHGGFVCN